MSTLHENLVIYSLFGLARSFRLFCRRSRNYQLLAGAQHAFCAYLLLLDETPARKVAAMILGANFADCVRMSCNQVRLRLDYVHRHVRQVRLGHRKIFLENSIPVRFAEERMLPYLKSAVLCTQSPHRVLLEQPRQKVYALGTYACLLANLAHVYRIPHDVLKELVPDKK